MTNQQLTFNQLNEQLKKHNFLVKPEHQEQLWNWVQFYPHSVEQLPALVEKIISQGQCSACSLPEFVIKQEQEEGDMKNHLICAGCQKFCDEGTKYRNNDYYSFHSRRCGAYVFWTRTEPVEEWYCFQCKFALLCGDCGAPHELDPNLLNKPAGEDFALCADCQAKIDEAEHEKHAWEPNLDCYNCQKWAKNWAEQQLATQKFPIKEFLVQHSHLVKFHQKELAGKNLTSTEEKKQSRIYEKRDKVHENICQELKRYFQIVTSCEYRFAGLPIIKSGIYGWAEGKIWQLLVCLGEPNHWRYKETNPDFWRENP